MDGIGIGNWYQITEIYKLLVQVWYLSNTFLSIT